MRDNYLDFNDNECLVSTAKTIGERRGGETGGDQLEALVGGKAFELFGL